jgi:alkaline phosphatase
LVRQAIFGDQTDGPLLDTASVSAVRQSQVGDIDGKATATREAAMTREGDHQLNRPIDPSITEVVEGTRAHGKAAGAVATARARSCRPVATASFEARRGQVFDTADALGDIRDILTWTIHGGSPDAKGVRSLF